MPNKRRYPIPPGIFFYCPPNRHRCNAIAIIELLGKSQPLSRDAIASILEKPLPVVKKTIVNLIANGEIKPTNEGYILNKVG